MTKQINASLKSAIASTVKAANSSLTKFAVELDDGRGIVLTAVDGPAIQILMIEAQELPALSEAVCSVDWSWINSSTVEDIKLDATAVRFQLNPAGPLTVSAGIWQGSPFLSFMPYRPAK